jgi:dihydrolipoamide dehydrogenase
MSNYDLIIIGGGPAGYVAAIKAAQKKLRVAVIEEIHLGGVCLNEGCIPTKAFLFSSNLFAQLTEASKFGISASNIQFDYKKVFKRKENVISRLRKGLEFLFKENNIKLFSARASFINKDTIKLQFKDRDDEFLNIKGSKVLIATGSLPKSLKELPIDHNLICDSSDILQLEELPRQLVILGGGVIGVEMATFFAQAGSSVTIVEALPRILSNFDEEAVNLIIRGLKSLKVKIYTSSYLAEHQFSENRIKLKLSSGEEIFADKVLVSVGRRAGINSLNPDKIDLKLDNGYIKVDQYLETNVKDIFAAGDVIGGLQLAHVASYEGELVVNNICAAKRVCDYRSMPVCIYTTPALAQIGFGINEEEVNRGKFPYQALGLACAYGKETGFVKIFSSLDTNTVIGGVVVGYLAEELIAVISVAVNNRMRVEELTSSIFAHPTFCEAIKESALGCIDQPVHLPKSFSGR